MITVAGTAPGSGTGQGLRLVVLALGLGLAAAQAQSAATTNSAVEPGPAGGAHVAPVQWQAERMELAQLGATNTAAAEAALAAWMDKLLAGNVPKEIHLEVIEAARKQKSPTVTEKLASYRDARLKEGGIACSSELLYGGDAERGRKVFFERKEAVCIKCHKVGQEGGDVGPPLTGGTTNRSREFILESVLRPDAQIALGYESFSLVLTDRHSLHGIIKGETDTELTIQCQPDEDSFDTKLVTVKKADIALRRKLGSAMPDGLDKTLSPWDLRDLIEFVAGLK